MKSFLCGHESAERCEPAPGERCARANHTGVRLEFGTRSKESSPTEFVGVSSHADASRVECAMVRLLDEEAGERADFGKMVSLDTMVVESRGGTPKLRRRPSASAGWATRRNRFYGQDPPPLSGLPASIGREAAEGADLTTFAAFSAYSGSNADAPPETGLAKSLFSSATYDRSVRRACATCVCSGSAGLELSDLIAANRNAAECRRVRAFVDEAPGMPDEFRALRLKRRDGQFPGDTP